MTLLDSHLDQITTSAKAIGDLEFPPPKIFTNALLGQHEITTLIRDTEPHERSLFTVDPNVSSGSASARPRKSNVFIADGSNRRKTVSHAQQRQGSAVAKVLGNEMLRQIQQSSRGQGRARGIDIEVLLKGAERLCAVYPVAGAKERISRARNRHFQYVESISHYEGLVSSQQVKLSKLHSARSQDDGLEEEDGTGVAEAKENAVLTEDDLLAEEREIRDLEAKKRALESRVAGIEKDLGGLLQ